MHAHPIYHPNKFEVRMEYQEVYSENDRSVNIKCPSCNAKIGRIKDDYLACAFIESDKYDKDLKLYFL